jgi:tripartite-type tricarboxylate transporter receptor subunit TctC
VLPDTVTTAQADLPQYKFDGWFGLGAPAGVPRDILERLNAALNEALKDPTVRVRFEEIGAVPTGLELDKAKTFLVDEVVKYRDIITKAEIAKIE